MITPADRKILMLKRMTQRLQRNNAGLRTEIDLQIKNSIAQAERIKTLITRLRQGNGASAPVPAEWEASYKWAADYIERNKVDIWPDMIISVFQDPVASVGKTTTQLHGWKIADWKVVQLVEGINDLEFVREWVYNW